MKKISDDARKGLIQILLITLIEFE